MNTITIDTTVGQLISLGLVKSVSELQKTLNKQQNEAQSSDDAKIDFAMECFEFMINHDNAVSVKFKTGKVLKKWYPKGYNHLRADKMKMAQVKMKHRQISAGWKVLMELGLVTSHCDTNNVAHTYYYIVPEKMKELLNPVVEEPVIAQELVEEVEVEVEVETVTEVEAEVEVETEVQAQEEIIERTADEEQELAALIAEQQAEIEAEESVVETDEAEIENLFD